MKVPCRWLSEYVEIDVTREEIERLAERLTFAGVEVEEIAATGALRSAVVGRVVSARPHPNADSLTLCSVDVGGRSLEIVCGASNVVEGALVPVVLAGGELPGGHRIGRRKIRGRASDGMICSKQELGLEARSEGIWNFDPALDLAVGTDLNELLEYDDFVLDIKVFSNRPDCAGIYGIAREAAAVLDRPLRPLPIEIEESDPPASERVSIRIEDPADAPRYAARWMDGVGIGPAPLRLQHRLVKAGMRPRSNVVDATNIVMLELGHPLHPFDGALVEGPIVVRRAEDGERFRTLDGVDRTLTPEVLMIADQRGGLALAGVMGGERSEIRPETTSVLLEAAAFGGYRVRLSSRSIGVRSEASQRFEREIDPEGVPIAAARAAHLIQRITGCRVARGIADAYPAPRSPRSIRLRTSRIRDVLGLQMDPGETRSILGRLGISAELDGTDLLVAIPSFRADLEREIDLVEEAGRIYGYDRLTSTTPRPVLRVGRVDADERGRQRVRRILTGLGMDEVVLDGFDKREWREALEISDQDLVRTRNPMSASQSALRSSLLPGLLSVIETNLHQGVDGGMIFEIGRVFSTDAGEGDALAGATFGRTGRPLRGKETVSLELTKGIVDGLFAALRVGEVDVDPSGAPAFLHPGRSGRFIVGDREIGSIGELAPAIVDRLAVPTTAFAFEIRAADLWAGEERPVEAAALPRFPASKRDLSLVAPLDLPEAEIRAILRSEPAVESVLLYDLYRGEQVGEDRKSLTYEIALRANDRTLTDDETAEIIARLAERLAERDVRLRA